MIALTCGTSTGLRARAVESAQLSAVEYFCGPSGGTASGLAGERLESCSAGRTASRMALSSNSSALVLPVCLSLVTEIDIDLLATKPLVVTPSSAKRMKASSLLARLILHSGKLV